MRRFWIAYLVLGTLLLAYTALGKIASHTTRIVVGLSPGEMAQASVLRLNGGEIRVSAHLGGVRHGRERSTFEEQEMARFDIDLSVRSGPPSRFSLGKTIGWGAEQFTRELLLVAGPPVYLDPGLNRIELKVASVDLPLAGKSIEVWVDPALRFKSADDPIQWLWLSFLSAIYLPIYLLVGFGAAGIQFWRSRG